MLSLKRGALPAGGRAWAEDVLGELSAGVWCWPEIHHCDCGDEWFPLASLSLASLSLQVCPTVFRPAGCFPSVGLLRACAYFFPGVCNGRRCRLRGFGRTVGVGTVVNCVHCLDIWVLSLLSGLLVGTFP